MQKYCVTLVCNAGYLDKAVFIASQLQAQKNRNFDIVICCDVAPSELPVALPEGVKIRQLDITETLTHLPQNERLKHYTYWRLPAIQALTQEYERVLYLDTDVFVARDGLSDLFGLDMKGTTLAAVRDVHQRHRPDRSALEFKAMGYPNAPYFNAGMLLIQSAGWNQMTAYKHIMQLAKDRPDALFCHDQSLLNIFFYQNWLELSPVWNWQYSNRVSLVGEFISPYLIHFVGSTKIWSEPDGSIPLKYHIAFAAQHGDEVPTDQNLERLPKFLLKNLWYWRRTWAYVAQFPKASNVILHQKSRESDT